MGEDFRLKLTRDQEHFLQDGHYYNDGANEYFCIANVYRKNKDGTYSIVDKRLASLEWKGLIAVYINETLSQVFVADEFNILEFAIDNFVITRNYRNLRANEAESQYITDNGFPKSLTAFDL